MFKLAQSATFQWPVKLRTPDAGGHVVTAEWTGVFRRFKQSEVEQLVEQGAKGELDDKGTARRVLAGWGADVCAADGSAMEFTAENLDAVLEVAGMPGAIVRAFFDGIYGGARKN